MELFGKMFDQNIFILLVGRFLSKKMLFNFNFESHIWGQHPIVSFYEQYSDIFKFSVTFLTKFVVKFYAKT